MNGMDHAQDTPTLARGAQRGPIGASRRGAGKDDGPSRRRIVRLQVRRGRSDDQRGARLERE